MPRSPSSSLLSCSLSPHWHPFHFSSVLFVGRAVRLRPQTRLNWSDPRTCLLVSRAPPAFPDFNTGFASRVQTYVCEQAKDNCIHPVRLAFGRLPRTNVVLRGGIIASRRKEGKSNIAGSMQNETIKRDRVSVWLRNVTSLIVNGPSRDRDRN